MCYGGLERSQWRLHLAVGGDESGRRLPSSLPENVILKICPVQLETRDCVRTRNKNLGREAIVSSPLKHYISPINTYSSPNNRDTPTFNIPSPLALQGPRRVSFAHHPFLLGCLREERVILAY